MTNDIKAQFIAASMLEGVDQASRVVLVPAGGKQRNCRKDVKSIGVKEQENTIVVEMNRAGLYDLLPEGLFHLPSLSAHRQTVREVIQAMKARREEERAARTLFMPFDVALNEELLFLAVFENSYSNELPAKLLVEFFGSAWPIVHLFDERQSRLFLKTLPVLNQVRNDNNLIEEFITGMLGDAVWISSACAQQSVQLCGPALGMARVGVDLVTNTNYVFDNQQVRVTVGPLSRRAFTNYKPGSTSRKLLDALLNLLLPADYNVDLVFEFLTSERETRLNSGACVGIDLYI